MRYSNTRKLNDLFLDDQDSTDGEDMGLLNLFEQTDEDNFSPLTELLNEGSNETSNEKMVSKTQGMKVSHYMYYGYR